MNVQSHLIASLTLFGLAACASTSSAETEPANDSVSQPNIIVVLADDLGWGDVGLNGATMIKTPHIDRIGNEGVRLTSFYAGANVCTPSRAALLSGRYPIRSGMQHVIMPHSQDGLPQSEITVPELLKDAGYATGMVGKWHLGHSDEYWPTAHGFDDFFGVAYSNDMQPFDLYDQKTVIESPADQTAVTDNYAAAASDFIRKHAETPFFLYYAETFPHIPLFTPERADGQSDAGHYGDVVEHLDHGIGVILETLDELGIADNTLILVTSDNGPWFEGDSGPFRDLKGSTHEGGYRVPFLARWPASIPAGTVSDEMTMASDLLPTFAVMAGAEVPTDRVIDGKDIRGVLQSGAESPHKTLFFFNGNNVAAVRDKRFRLVLSTYYKSFEVPFEQFGGKLLFDLANDSGERFSYVREYPEIVASLQAEVDALREEVSALVKDPINPFPPTDPNIAIGPQLAED